MNKLGQILLAILDVDLANIGTESTFNRNGVKSVIDITFGSFSLTNSSYWRVDDAHIQSNQLPVHYSIRLE